MPVRRILSLLKSAFPAFIFVCGLFAASGLLVAQQPYHILDRWAIGGAGSWDYLTADPSAHRLYITHGPRVEVFDTRSGKPIGTITGLQGPRLLSPSRPGACDSKCG